MRLNKYLATAGIASRRHADALIEAGRISVNGELVTKLGTVVNEEKDEVRIDGEVIELTPKIITYVLNKPRHVVTTAEDPEGRKTVLDFVPRSPRVFPCGRLDYDTMGLVVLTNDGNLCYQLTHPKYEHEKVYVVEGRTRTPVAAWNELSEGNLQLKDGPVKIDRLELIKKSHDKLTFKITVHEGRNRLVRRICDAVGIEVTRLTRVKLGHYELGDLAPGEYRRLT